MGPNASLRKQLRKVFSGDLSWDINKSENVRIRRYMVTGYRNPSDGIPLDIIVNGWCTGSYLALQGQSCSQEDRAHDERQ
jgi:hypothetical protein